MATKPKSLTWGLMDVDKFVRLNNLQEVTSPIALNKGAPTPDGVLSYEIFGVSQQDRRSRMAYIDLHDHYMNPLAAIKLAAYDRRMNRILMSQGYYKLTDKGDLVEDEEKGKTGPEFLYSIWGKVKVKDKTTITTKELQDFFENTPKNLLFITKYPVMPAFFRDVNTSTGTSSKSHNQINNWYSSMISYSQTLANYTDTLTSMGTVTRSRIQTIINDIYRENMVKTVKGQPSKFGMLRQYFQGKNVNYSSRLVITVPQLRKDSFSSVIVKFGYAAIPLQHICSCFLPFIIRETKRFFDAEFIEAGKYEAVDKNGKPILVTFDESYSENDITEMLTTFLESPYSRFDPVPLPSNPVGEGYMILNGRFNKDNTTFSRPMTYTDLFYIIAKRVVQDKHVIITRYPLDNYNGQFPVKIEVSSTLKTQPVTIGNEVYQFFPVSVGNPETSFITSVQFSNTMLKMMGGDYDGDTVSVKPVYSKQANAECEMRINSNEYIMNVEGKLMRPAEKDFLICVYVLTNSNNKQLKEDINKEKPKYVI